jgi:hypothetical protein
MYVCVLVWFRLGILILISGLCGIPDCMSSDFVSFCLFVGKILVQSWCIFVLQSSCNVYHVWVL